MTRLRIFDEGGGGNSVEHNRVVSEQLKAFGTD